MFAWLTKLKRWMADAIPPRWPEFPSVEYPADPKDYPKDDVPECNHREVVTDDLERVLLPISPAVPKRERDYGPELIDAPATPEARSVAEDDDLATFGVSWPPVSPVQCSNITVHFSPNGQCTDAICAAICAAESCVTVHAYVLTSLAIAESLIAARGRGLVVDVILDKRETSSRHSKYRMLVDGGVTVYLDAGHRISHNKVVLVDGWKTITGSFNLSAGAEANAENMLIIRSSAVVNAYMDNWKMHRAHCELLKK